MFVYTVVMKTGVSCVYIMTNKRNGTLYTGVTSHLRKRIQEHKSNKIKGFTQLYKLHTLVYYNCGESIEGAITEEKRIKAGSRKNKLTLIENMNPDWKDLTSDL